MNRCLISVTKKNEPNTFNSMPCARIYMFIPAHDTIRRHKFKPQGLLFWHSLRDFKPFLIKNIEIVLFGTDQFTGDLSLKRKQGRRRIKTECVLNIGNDILLFKSKGNCTKSIKMRSSLKCMSSMIQKTFHKHAPFRVFIQMNHQHKYFVMYMN